MQKSSETSGLHTLRQDYERDGYVIARQAIDASLVQEVVQHTEWLRAKYPQLRPENLHTGLVTNDPFWVRLVSDERLLAVVEQFIGLDIALFASHYIAKRPFDGQPVLWHQDGSFWPLEPMEVVSLWLAADDSTLENGCMQVIPGSHQMNLQEMHEQTEKENVLGAEMDPALVDESQAVAVILQAGDISIHHPNIIHGSNANTSALWRRGLTIRYIPTSTRILNKKHPSTLWLAGKLVPSINNYQPWPKYVEGEHMPFHGWQEWNQRCDEWNERLHLSGQMSS